MGIVNGTGFLKSKTGRLEKELCSDMIWEPLEQSIVWLPQKGLVFSTEVNNENQGSNQAHSFQLNLANFLLNLSSLGRLWFLPEAAS